MEVSIRPFNHPSDAGFIYGTITKGIYFASPTPKNLPPYDKFTQNFSTYLKDQLEHSKIFVAHTPSQPDFLIGYSIINNSTLEWVFVKPLFRNHGIASLLIKNKGITQINEKNLTKVGQAIMKNHAHLFKKDPSHESTTSKTN